MNAKDWNGHVPDDPEPAAPFCPYDDGPERAAWIEGYLAAVALVAARGQQQLDVILGRSAAA